MANLQEGAGGAQRQSNRRGLARFCRAPRFDCLGGTELCCRIIGKHLEVCRTHNSHHSSSYAYCAVRHECIQTAVLLAVHFFVPLDLAQADDARSAHAGLDVTDVTIEGHAQDIKLRLYRLTEQKRTASTALFSRRRLCAARWTTPTSPRALFRGALTGAGRLGRLLACAAISVSHGAGRRTPRRVVGADPCTRRSLAATPNISASRDMTRAVQIANCLAKPSSRVTAATYGSRRRRCSARCSIRVSRALATNSGLAPILLPRSAPPAIARTCRKPRSACIRMPRRSSRCASRACPPR